MVEPRPPGDVDVGVTGADDDDDVDDRLADVAAEMAEVRRRLAEVPAEQVVANHLMGLYELGAIHLSQSPTDFGAAALAIDAMAAVLDGLPGRLGEAESTLRDALAQIRLAFVQLKAAR